MAKKLITTNVKKLLNKSVPTLEDEIVAAERYHASLSVEVEQFTKNEERIKYEKKQQKKITTRAIGYLGKATQVPFTPGSSFGSAPPGYGRMENSQNLLAEYQASQSRLQQRYEQDLFDLHATLLEKRKELRRAKKRVSELKTALSIKKELVAAEKYALQFVQINDIISHTNKPLTMNELIGEFVDFISDKYGISRDSFDNLSWELEVTEKETLADETIFLVDIDSDGNITYHDRSNNTGNSISESRSRRNEKISVPIRLDDIAQPESSVDNEAVDDPSPQRLAAGDDYDYDEDDD